MIVLATRHSTPLGPLYATWTEAGLYRLDFTEPDSAIADACSLPQSRELQIALDAYFDDGATDFDSIPVDEQGWTPLSRMIYRSCREIPPGQTITYKELASRAERPNACRAVGAAMSRNRTLLVIPCHRVVASTGKLQGFSAPGGIATKRRLLELEKNAAYCV